MDEISENKLTESPSDSELWRMQLTVYILYSLLSAINFIYFFTRILYLKEKKFHLFMFILLQICYTSQILLSLFYNSDILKWILDDIYYASDEIVHSIFVIKYWALSRKILQIVNNSQDKHFYCKVRFIFTFQILLILSSSTAYSICGITGTCPISQLGYLILITFYTIPPYISLAILTEAFINLHKSNKSSISKTQIMIQLFAAIAFAISNTIYYFYFSMITTYARISLDFLSLLILTITLCKIADLQLSHQTEDFDQIEILSESKSPIQTEESRRVTDESSVNLSFVEDPQSTSGHLSAQQTQNFELNVIIQSTQISRRFTSARIDTSDRNLMRTLNIDFTH